MAQQKIELSEAEVEAINLTTQRINEFTQKREALIRSTMVSRGLAANLPFSMTPEGLMVGEKEES